MPAYAQYQVEMCSSFFCFLKSGQHSHRRGPAKETMQCIDSTYFLNMGFCASRISSSVWFLTLIQESQAARN